MASRDYFAELYVAGIMGDNGWNVYFPKRDVGFDFIATKEVGTRIVMRPVQFKGLYPSETKKLRNGYGFVGSLTALHDDMALILPYFPTDITGASPLHIAYMPRSQIKLASRGDHRCIPANFDGKKAVPRRDFARFFDRPGLLAMELAVWGQEVPPVDL